MKLFAKTHEWAEIEDGVATIGISDYAQSSLGDIVYVDLPEVGCVVCAGETLAEVESVKAVSEIFSPVGGEIIEVNEALMDSPESVNADCYSAWFAKIRVTDVPELMSEEAYLESVK